MIFPVHDSGDIGNGTIPHGEQQTRRIDIEGVGSFVISTGSDVKREPGVHIEAALSPHEDRSSFVHSAVEGVRVNIVQRFSSLSPPPESPGSGAVAEVLCQQPPSFASEVLSHLLSPHAVSHAHDQIQSLAAYATAELKITDPKAISLCCLKLIEKMELSSGKSLFALRYSLMLRIVEERIDIPTWRVFTKEPVAGVSVWDHVMELKNWVPEVRQLMAHSITMGVIRGRGLAEGAQSIMPTLELAKGGFGAGKTSFLTREHGSSSVGVVAPDRMKGELQHFIPGASSGQVHIQSSVLANALFDELNRSVQGRVVYDSAMTDPEYLGSFLQKAHETGKAAVINDIVRTDMVRALAVLGRKIGGEDPNIPVFHVISATVEDFATRRRCIALAVIPKELLGPDTVPCQIDYCLYLGDEMGGFAEDGVRMRYVQDPEEHCTVEYIYGSEDLSEEEKARTRSRIDTQLQALDISLTPEGMSGVSSVDEERRKEVKRKELCAAFVCPVADVMTGPPSQQKSMIQTCKCRCLVKDEAAQQCSSWEEFSMLMQDPYVRSVFLDTLHALQRPPAEVYPKWEDQHRIAEKLMRGEKVSYLDIPLALAIEMNSRLKEDPWAAE